MKIFTLVMFWLFLYHVGARTVVMIYGAYKQSPSFLVYLVDTFIYAGVFIWAGVALWCN